MKLTNNDKSFEADRSYLLEPASKTQRIFGSSKPEQKNKILKLLFLNFEINEKRLNCNPLEPFNASSTMSKSRNWLRQLDSNQHIIYKLYKTTRSYL